MEDKRIEKKPLIGVTLDREGEYVRIKRQYHEAVIKAGGIPLLIPHLKDPSGIAAIIDGLLIPGGGDIDPSYFSEEPHPSLKITPKERTDFEIDLLRAIMKVRKPVFGICYGMQLINVAFGGNLYQDIGSQLDAAIDHRKGLHRIMGNGNSFRREFIVNSSHHQAVKELGKGLTAAAFSEDGLIEAIRLDGYPFLIGVQWHPERSDDALSLSLFSSFVEKVRAGK